MTGAAPGCARAPRALAWLGLAFFLALYLIDFRLDTRLRDALCWMDPYQYYYFAADLVAGRRGLGQFEIPSIFPLFIAPFLAIDASIASGLWVNVLFLGLLCLALHHLRRRLEIGAPLWLLCAVTVSSPLLIGLSRSLYTEFALSAASAIAFAAWFPAEKTGDRRSLGLLALLFGLGTALKTTFPLFFAGPFALAAVRLARSRGWRHLATLAAALALPLAILAALYALARAPSWSYLLSLGNTQIPIMHLIGPRGIGSLESLLYYPAQLWRTMLWLLAPPLALALLWRPARARMTDPAALTLWAWLAGPLLLLTLQEVKEPRHVAPCVVPAVLLLLRGVSALRAPGPRRAAWAALLALALLQYGLVTGHRRAAPYFLDRPAHLARIGEILAAADPAGPPPPEIRPGLGDARWLLTKNVVLSGFEPNLALLFAWHLNPAVVYDLDILAEDDRRDRAVAYARFEDLYFLTAFNLYNRRCLWRRYDHTLDRETVLAGADFALVSAERAGGWDPRAAGFREAGGAGEGAQRVTVWAAPGPSAHSYRSLYARAFLAGGETLQPADSTAVCFDLAMNALWRRNLPEVRQWMAACPALGDGAPGMRNIYWTGKELQLRDATREALAAYGAYLEREAGATR